jgi:hypothetical protein
MGAAQKITVPYGQLRVKGDTLFFLLPLWMLLIISKSHYDNMRQIYLFFVGYTN